MKTIGPTAAPFTHCRRIVAHLHGGKTEVFRGHATSAKEAADKEAPTGQAARQHGWKRFVLEVVELTEHRRPSHSGQVDPDREPALRGSLEF